MNNSSISKIAQVLEPKKLPNVGKLDSVSDLALKAHHDKLYYNYVKNYNRMVDLLSKMRPGEIEDVPNSEFAELKRRISWASNGAYLHELYFGNLGGEGTNPGTMTKELIKQDFGDMDNFKGNVISAGLVPISGWSVWGYSIYDKFTYCAALENHHNNCPIGFFPLLVIDVWEHAYWKDHLANRKKYLQLSWKDINWDAVEERCLAVKNILSKL